MPRSRGRADGNRTSPPPVAGSCRARGWDDDAVNADDVIASPAGVALLQALEAEQPTTRTPFELPPSCDPVAVDTATAMTAELSWADLLQRLISSAESIGGPWIGDAPLRLTRAFALAPQRRPIAAALATRFTEVIHEIDRDQQEWWLIPPIVGSPAQPLHGTGDVYCCGEFTWDGIWTVTSPPAEVHDDLIDAWEMFPGPISRWRVPIRSEARVFEVHQPADWAQLVTRFPRRGTRAHGGWELPGPNQHHGEVHELELVSCGIGARTQAEVFMPDWAAVATEFDGVHLSWLGKLTCEGRVIDLPELGRNAVSLVRYWGSERTTWLNDVFGTPSPAVAPALSGRINGDTGIDDSAPQRIEADMAYIAARLDRNPFTLAKPLPPESPR